MENDPIHRDSDGKEIDVEETLFVSIYDRQSYHTTLKINRKITAKDICHAIASKIDLARPDMQFYTLVLVVTVLDPIRKTNLQCVRTIQNQESVLSVLDTFLTKIMEKYQTGDFMRLKNAVKWFFKDLRSNPMEFNEQTEMIGEFDSDDEEEISHSDLAYLTKSDRKGYLLKRSSKDQNVWRKWYCILTDHLWCVDLTTATSKALCIKLSGVVRYKDGVAANEQIQNIIITSSRKTHLFRSFSLTEQKKWIEELNLRTVYGSDNEAFQMAEVIMSDEVRSQMTRKGGYIKRGLETDIVTEILMKDTRYIIDRGEKEDKREDVMIEKESDRREEEGERIEPPTQSNNNHSSSSVNNNSIIKGESKPPSLLLPLPPLLLPLSPHSPPLHPLDPTQLSLSLHRFHLLSPSLTRIFRFFLAVSHYREMFRHDLQYSPGERRKVGEGVYREYIFPLLSPSSSSPHSPAPSLSPSTCTAQPREGLGDWGVSEVSVQKLKDLFPSSSALSTDPAGGWESRRAGEESLSSSSPIRPPAKGLERGVSSLFFWPFAGGGGGSPKPPLSKSPPNPPSVPPLPAPSSPAPALAPPVSEAEEEEREEVFHYADIFEEVVEDIIKHLHNYHLT